MRLLAWDSSSGFVVLRFWVVGLFMVGVVCVVICGAWLAQVFSAFGFVQKIAIFEKSAGFQALVQYPGMIVVSAVYF